MTLQDLARLLNGKISKDQVECPGPGHSSSDHSLSVKLDATAPGGFIVHSHAGDDWRACRDYVKEKIGGLLDELQPNDSYPQTGCDQPIKFEITHSDDGLLEDCKRSMNGRKPDVKYLYRTETGDGIHYAVARWEPQNEGEEKQIRPFVFDGKRWLSKGHPAPRPLYNLDKISGAKDKPVLIVEGEKSAEAASTFYGGPVTTWCGGAKAVSKTDFGPLRGRDVVLCPDNDDPGRNAMAQAAALLHASGANVKIVNLLELAKARPSGPDIPEGWDVADALQEDWAPEALREALESCALPYDANTEKSVAPVARVAPMEPLPLYPPLALPEPYPIEALGCTLGNVAQAIANKCQVPEAMAAQSVLAVASLIGQPHANVILPFGQTRPISLYIITVAGSGDRKSTADNEALRGMIEHEGVLRAKYDADFHADSCDAAQAYRFDAARDSWMMPPTVTR